MELFERYGESMIGRAFLHLCSTEDRRGIRGTTPGVEVDTACGLALGNSRHDLMRLRYHTGHQLWNGSKVFIQAAHRFAARAARARDFESKLIKDGHRRGA